MPRTINIAEHEAFWTDQLKVATADIEKAAVQRRTAAAARYHAIHQLRGIGWSLQRIADELGVSKAAIAKAGSAEATRSEMLR